MSQENVTLTQNIYEAFGRGDMAPFLGAMDPNVEWHEPGGPGYPYPGVHQGVQGVLGEVFGQVPSLYEEFNLASRDFVDAGDRVIVLGDFYGKAKTSGTSFQVPFVHIFTYRDGKCVHYQNYTDSGTIAAALK
ncbi:MAG TPA: nuclear transport factor 2 family protein [Ktedonobacteraceae bacterium]|nr:nuclear transport factor 2 family protein [Ktedonobacteraceae bacterium]